MAVLVVAVELAAEECVPSSKRWCALPEDRRARVASPPSKGDLHTQALLTSPVEVRVGRGPESHPTPVRCPLLRLDTTPLFAQVSK